MTTPTVPPKKKPPVRKPEMSLIKGFMATDADVNTAASMKNEDAKYSFSGYVHTKACPDNPGSFDLLVGKKVVAYILKKGNEFIAFKKKDGDTKEGAKLGSFTSKEGAKIGALQKLGLDSELIELAEANGIYSPLTDQEVARDNLSLERRGGKLQRGPAGSFRVVTDGNKTLKQAGKVVKEEHIHEAAAPKPNSTEHAKLLGKGWDYIGYEAENSGGHKGGFHFYGGKFNRQNHSLVRYPNGQWEHWNDSKGSKKGVGTSTKELTDHLETFHAEKVTKPQRVGHPKFGRKVVKEATEPKQLRRGDVVEVTKKGSKYEGATGEIDELGPDSKLISVDLYNHGKHPFHATDLTLADLSHEQDDTDATKFYVAFYDNDEERSWIGVVTKENGGKWHEKPFQGKPGYRWGVSYMSYLTPSQIMTWIHRDYPRGVEIEGPFMSSEEAENYVSGNWGSLKESTMKINEGIRKVGEEESDDGRVVAKIYYDSDYSEFRIKHYVDGKYKGENADGFSDDKEDAIGTAKHNVASYAKKLKTPRVTEAADVSKTHKLVDEKTGEEVKLPATLKDFRGDKVRVISFTPPHRPGTSGYIYTKDGSRFYPGVVDCEIIPRDAVAEEQLDEISPDRIELMRKQIDKALDHSDPKIRATAFNSDHATPGHIAKGLSDDDWEVRRAATKHKSATARLLQRAATDDNLHVRRAAAAHPNAGVGSLKKSAGDHYMGVARHGKGNLGDRGIREGAATATTFRQFLGESKVEDEFRRKAEALARKMLGTDDIVRTPIISKRAHPALEEVNHKFLDTKAGQWVAKKMKCKKTENECIHFVPPRGSMAAEFYIKPRAKVMKDEE